MRTETGIPRVVDDFAIVLVVMPGPDLFLDRMEHLERPLETERQQNRHQQQSNLFSVGALGESVPILVGN